MSEDGNAAYGAEAFAEGNWYHELLEDGLALSYRVRGARRRRRRRDGADRRGCRVDARMRDGD